MAIVTRQPLAATALAVAVRAKMLRKWLTVITLEWVLGKPSEALAGMVHSEFLRLLTGLRAIKVPYEAKRHP